MPKPKPPPPPAIITNTGVYANGLPWEMHRPASGGPFPVVIMVMDGTWTSNDFAVPRQSAIRLAQEEGFAAVTIGLRTAPTWHAPAPMEDCAAWVDWIVANAALYNLDPDNIAAMGGSGGGHVASFLAFGTYLRPDQLARIKCVAAASPPCDLPTMGAESPGSDPLIEAFLGVSEAEGLATWEFFSPTHRAAPDTKPILLVYSVGDGIPPAQGDRLATVLAANGVEHQMVTVAGSAHGWWLITSNAEAWSAIVGWLRGHL